jgi:hypothetical protein
MAGASPGIPLLDLRNFVPDILSTMLHNPIAGGGRHLPLRTFAE